MIKNKLNISNTIFYSTFFSLASILLISNNLFYLFLISLIIIFLFAYYKKNSVLFFSLGLNLIIALNFIFQQKTYNKKLHYFNKSINIYGKIIKIEISKINKSQTHILLAAKKIELNNSNFKINKNISIFIKTEIDNLTISDEIKLKNVKLLKPTNLSYAQYLIKEKIYAVTHCYKNQIICLKKNSNQNNKIKKNFLTRLKSKLSKESNNLFELLFTGENNKNLLKNKIRTESGYFGILHQIARSGLHLMIILSIINFLLLFIPINQKIKYFITLIFILLYYFYTQTSVSFNRALYMIIIYLTNKIFNLQISAIYILALVTIITLIKNPITALFLDFQLSFGIMFIILILNKLKKTIDLN